jgi:hypothetical protein
MYRFGLSHSFSLALRVSHVFLYRKKYGETMVFNDYRQSAIQVLKVEANAL